MKTAFVTGASGFIGFYTCKKLLENGLRVVGIDNLNSYYAPYLKNKRQEMLEKDANFEIINECIEKPTVLREIFKNFKPNLVIHLAAQAGVRNSIESPRQYFESNLQGSFELLEAARNFPPEHLLISSTSSVYGANKEMPYKENMKVDHQVSFYAASKKAVESIAHSYSHIYGLPTTIFRFFTVYGPWGRPDMAYFSFTKSILEGTPIKVFNQGKMKRDFTYIEDLVESLSRLVEHVPRLTKTGDKIVANDSLSPVAPFRIINIGNSRPVKLTTFIDSLEMLLGKKAKRVYSEMQKGDVIETWADSELLKSLIKYQPDTPLDVGLSKFVEWYLNFYNYDV